MGFGAGIYFNQNRPINVCLLRLIPESLAHKPAK